MSYRNLETRVYDDSDMRPYRSKSEKIIAELLDKYGIAFKYEKDVCIEDWQNKTRLWYPDFYLKDYDVLIEYLGRREGEKEEDYLKRVEYKKRIYEKMVIKAIFFYPEDMWEIVDGKPKYKKEFEEHFLRKLNEKIGDENYSRLKNAKLETTVASSYTYSSQLYN